VSRARVVLPQPGAGERRVAARSVAWGGVESAAAAAVGLLLTPLVVRTAGIEGLGLWGAAWSLAHTAGLIDLGIGASYARFTARALASDDPEDLNGTVAAGVGFHLVLALLVAFGAVAFGPLLLARVATPGPRLVEARDVLACTIATVLLRGTLSVYRGVVSGAQRTDILARIGAVAALVEGAGAAAALLWGLGLRGMAVNSLGAAAATSAAEAVAAHRLCPALRVRPFAAGRRHFGDLLGFSVRLQVTRAVEILASHAPRLLLAAGPGLAAAGAYDLAARIANLTSVAATLPLRVVLPLAGHLDARGDRARLDALVDRASRYVALLALPPAAVVLACAAPILAAWTGQPAPSAAIAAARLLAPAVAIAMLASPLRLAVRGIGHPGIEACATAAGAMVQIGVLAGAVVSAAVLATLVRGRARGADPGSARRALAAPLAAGALAAGAGLALDLLAGASSPATRPAAIADLLPRLAVVTGVFAGSVVLLKAVRAADLILLRDALAPFLPRGLRAAAGTSGDGSAA
jgi:O-antigen/teichoic acid export membrane protein